MHARATRKQEQTTGKFTAELTQRTPFSPISQFNLGSGSAAGRASGWCSREKESTRCTKHTRRGEGRGETPVRTKQKLPQTRAGQTRGLGSRSRRHRPSRERWEEARGGRRPQPTMLYGGPVTRRRRADDGEAEQSRRARRGREQDVLRRSAGGCTKRLGAAGTRGTMWKTASASLPSGGRPRLKP